MNATLKLTKTIKAATALPPLPAPRQRGRRNELQGVEAMIHSLGGKPMNRMTKQRLASAGCVGFPED